MSSEIEHAERLAEIDQKRDRRYDRCGGSVTLNILVRQVLLIRGHDRLRLDPVPEQ
jgi:hypothetical protein